MNMREWGKQTILRSIATKNHQTPPAKFTKTGQKQKD